MFPTSQQQQFTAPQPQVYGNPTFTPTFVQPTNQFPPATNQQQFFLPQQSFSPQQQYTNPQQPIRPEWTGAGFGGYTPSTASSPVNIMPTISSLPPSQPQFQQQAVQNTTGLQPDRNSTGTNPFRASMLPNLSSAFSPTDQGTNPFQQQRSQTMPPVLTHTQPFSSQTSFAPSQPQSTFQPFSNPSQPTFQQSTFQPQPSVFQQSNQPQPVFSQQQPQPAPVQVSASTGTNPFSRPQFRATEARLTPQVTGSNPFRQSVMPGGASTSSTTTGVPNGFGWSQ